MGHRTEETDISITPSLMEDIELTSKLRRKLELESPSEILQYSISTRSVISTSSSFAQRYQKAAEDEELQKFKPIGAGSCGTVLEWTGTAQVVKLEKRTTMISESLKLWNDYLMHTKILEAFTTVSKKNFDCEIRVPRCYAYVNAADREWWDNNSDRFPQDLQQPTNGLFTERILPVPAIMRQALIEEFCPEHLKGVAKGDPSNKQCLVRLYLGKRLDDQPSRSRPQRFFSLRNFNLTLDNMQKLTIDTSRFISSIAEALAIMHWVAKVDAADVEFVLGSAPSFAHITSTPTFEQLQKLPPNSSTHRLHDFTHRTLHVWLLDFNLCKQLAMNDVGIQQAVKAFFANDPYYPRPHSTRAEDRNLWNQFEHRYLAVSCTFIEPALLHLPQQFIQAVKHESSIREAKKAEASRRSATETAPPG
ncbi:hypothetical protein G7Y79_00019g047120 [Physcia stellaris]|nr:hypothetical protein G7Y79_00019g047120 [Physcia stellaris]